MCCVTLQIFFMLGSGWIYLYTCWAFLSHSVPLFTRIYVVPRLTSLSCSYLSGHHVNSVQVTPTVILAQTLMYHWHILCQAYQRLNMQSSTTTHMTLMSLPWRMVCVWHQRTNLDNFVLWEVCSLLQFCYSFPLELQYSAFHSLQWLLYFAFKSSAWKCTQSWLKKIILKIIMDLIYSPFHYSCNW